MGHAHGAFGLVDVLSARARGTIDIDAQVFFVDFDIDIFHFRQDGDGRGRSVDATHLLGRRHALDAMHAGLEAELAIDIQPADFVRSVLEPALRSARFIELGPLPALILGIFLIHHGKLFGKESGLFSAGARADFHDDLIREFFFLALAFEDRFHLRPERVLLSLQVDELGFGKILHRGIFEKDFPELLLLLVETRKLRREVRGFLILLELFDGE